MRHLTASLVDAVPFAVQLHSQHKVSAHTILQAMLCGRMQAEKRSTSHFSIWHIYPLQVLLQQLQVRGLTMKSESCDLPTGADLPCQGKQNEQ